ncbi:MAG: methyl-accepting chemotaxis protein, partial [Chromatiaceae bacterium]|nr:methyl-accepting chemotaxis protein [Chromatiaceae bacterium]
WDWVVGGGSYVAEFTRDSIQLRNRLMVFAALAGALLVGLLFWFNRSRLAPLTDLSRALGRLGEGDLRVAFAAADEGASDSGNEIRALGAQARGTLHNLRQLIMHIRDEAGRLDEVIGQLRVLMSSTDGQMDEQLTQAEQLASAITQLGASAEEITRNTHDTSGAAASARQSAASGRETIDSLATEIERVTTNLAGAGEIVETLNGDAERIGKVLDVIRGIADQTNLLALNAAIEAARAGEQGRGFSVVADEVRQLALRTQESTAEIQQMIASLQGSATRAVGSMREMRELTASLETSARSTNETFGGILDAIHRVDEMSTQISAALTEQLAVVEELQQRVVVVRDGAQQSAGEMRKGLDRAQALEAVSQSLQQQIGTFRLP